MCTVTSVHELSICRSIVDIVTRHADGRAVDTVHLQVGALRQIVPDTLVYCWGLINADTPLASSQLVVDHVPGALRCRPCDRTQILADAMLICETCGGQDVEIVGGEEFLITTLELAEA